MVDRSGRVMQFFCDVEKPDNTPFGGNCRGFLRDINRRFKQLGLRCNVGTECEFYLFENDDRGRPTRIPIDAGGYFDVAPLDAGENIRRDIAGILHTLNQAFDNLYDNLLSDVAMDVSSEIAALQGMLANDGLTGRDFQ